MAAFNGIFMILFLLVYLASFIPGIILLVRLIQMGIACIKLGNFAPRERIRYVDSRKAKALWVWTLTLSIIAAVSFFAFGVASDDIGAFIISIIFPILYLNPQIALLVAGKIIMNKYSNAFVRYKTWQRRQAEAAAAPVIEANIAGTASAATAAEALAIEEKISE